MLIQDGAARKMGQWALLVSVPHPYFNRDEGVVPAAREVTREEVLITYVHLSLRKKIEKLISHLSGTSTVLT